MDHTTCLISGGGPAGIMLGLILARGGVEVTVCEKHADFLRDFRGDTVHAATIRLLDELGLGKRFAALPQTHLQEFELPTGDGGTVTFGDFSALPAPYNYIAMTPQWDLLTMLANAAAQEPNFNLRMNTEILELIKDEDRVVGATYATTDGKTGEIRADLTVACDGRSSVLRDQSGLPLQDFEVPFDVWWFRLPRPESEQGEVSPLAPAFVGKEIMLAISRVAHHQVAYFIPKGKDAEFRARGLEDFKSRIANLRPDYAPLLSAVTSMDDVKTLNVALNRLEKWHLPGFLCIGDAAHAMSPAGGVGVNLAIQDAVAAGTILAEPLLAGTVDDTVLDQVRKRRMLPTKILQYMQSVMQDVIFKGTFEGKRSGPPRFIINLLRYIPILRGLPPRLVAFGPRPEHAPDFARRAES